MPKYYTGEFTKEQESQIEIVHNCVVALLSSMLAVPDYLKGTNVKGLGDFEDAPIPESEIADLVAHYLEDKKVGNIFYPIRVHDANAEIEWIQDTFNDDEIYADPEAEPTEEQWLNAWNYLNFMIAEYASLGMAGQFGLKCTLLPLKARYDAGERSKELFNEISKCE